MAVQYDFEQPISGVDLRRRWEIAREASGNHTLKHIRVGGVVDSGSDSMSLPCPIQKQYHLCMRFKPHSVGVWLENYLLYITSQDVYIQGWHRKGAGDVLYPGIQSHYVSGGFESGDGWHLLDLNLGPFWEYDAGIDYPAPVKGRDYELAVDKKLRARGSIEKTAAFDSRDDPLFAGQLVLQALFDSNAEIDDIRIGTSTTLETVSRVCGVNLYGDLEAGRSALRLMPWDDLAASQFPGEKVLFVCAPGPGERSGFVDNYRINPSPQWIRQTRDILRTGGVTNMHGLFIKSDELAALLLDGVVFQLRMSNVTCGKSPMDDFGTALKELTRLKQEHKVAFLLKVP